MKKHILTIIVGLIIANVSMAQQLPLYNQYYINPYLYNPSMAGASEGINANLLHKSQWRDIPGAPETSILTLDGRIDDSNTSLGATFFNDVSGIFQRQGAYGTYSYRIMINDEHTVYAGLSVGVLNNRIDFNRVMVKDVNDPFLMQGGFSRASFDASMGATYLWKDLEVGIAAPHIIGQNFRFMSNDASSNFQNSRNLLVSAKYVFTVMEDKGMSAYPLVMVRAAQGAPVQYDINAVFDWQNIGWAALTYRSNYAVGINLGVKINESIRAGYAYEIPVNAVGNNMGGSSEILLGYRFNNSGSSKNEDLSHLTQDTQYDLMVDSMMFALKRNDEEQKTEIKRLSDEVEKLKAGKIEIPENSKSNPNNTSDTKFGKTDDYKDDEGNKIEPGNYVVIGSFTKKENALKALDQAKEMGYSESQTIFNNVNKFHYVFILKTEDATEAKQTLNKISTKVPDSWVFVLE
ncbi:MAG: PorP/SprF family type IX secretion system membrane protein [Bacteroidota bacterium]|nr:PorP/SprF family type IX secretion system membrane protein [Bacteroidota bacterium]